MNYSIQKEVNIPVGKVAVQGNLTIPEQAKAIVMFSHGSGSSRLSKRNRQVAAYLQQKKLGTLLFDLLTPEEDRFYENRFDIQLLSKRLIAVKDWFHKQAATKDYPIAYFGAGRYQNQLTVRITICYNEENFKRKLLLTTLTLLNAIAAPAIIGSSKNPFTGYNTPAAMGIPIKL